MIIHSPVQHRSLRFPMRKIAVFYSVVNKQLTFPGDFINKRSPFRGDLINNQSTFPGEGERNEI